MVGSFEKAKKISNDQATVIAKQGKAVEVMQKVIDGLQHAQLFQVPVSSAGKTNPSNSALS